MKVIDKILNEWSFRCHDGIVDLDNPEKVKILEEILSKDQLIDLINNTDLNNEQILKIQRFVSKRTKKLGVNDEIKTEYKKRGAERISPLIIYLANELDEEEQLRDFLQKGSKVSFEQLLQNNNLVELFSNKGLSETFIRNLIKITANQIGAGELALITFLNNTKKIPGKSGHGDVNVEGNVIELKGKGAALTGWKNKSKSDIQREFDEIYKDTKVDDKITYKDNWLKQLERDLKGENKEKAKQVIEKLYPESEFNINLEDLRKSIAQNYVDQYLKDNKINYMFVLNESTGNYQIFDKETFKNEIGNKIKISFDKDTAPRIELNTNIQEGARYSENNEVLLSTTNDPQDLLNIGLKDATIGGVNVYYSMDYNQKNPNASEIKDIADDIKELKNLQDKNELYDIIYKDLDKLFSLNFKPKVIYYLGSSAPLSKQIGNIIETNFPDIRVLPLSKIKFPSWEDMLIPDYKEKIESESMLKRIETTAANMWEKNKGSIKSSKLDSELRKYFKPKYRLEDIIEEKEMMFVDDNVQTGTDFRTISEKFFNNPHILYYTVIRLSRAGSKTTSASTAAKKTNIEFTFKQDDLKKFPNGIGVKSTYSDIGKLISKGYVKKDTIRLGGITYYLFANTNLTLDDLLKKAE